MARPRKKKNIPQRMEACSEYWFLVPIANKGKWRQVFRREDAPLYLELGCGRGKFSCEMALANPDICFVALEKDESVVLSAIERAAEMKLSNIRFLHADVELLRNYFEEGEVDRIFINFCDPWMRKKKPKRRLTYRANLEIYKELLKPEGQIHFKTDEPALFAFSIGEFWSSQFILDKLTLHLYDSPWIENNIATEFETKFVQEGLPIYRLEAHRTESECKEICTAFPVELDNFLQ